MGAVEEKVSQIETGNEERTRRRTYHPIISMPSKGERVASGTSSGDTRLSAVVLIRLIKLCEKERGGEREV